MSAAASSLAQAGIELQPLQLPEAIGIWPLAWGWWLLLMLFIALLLVGFWLLKRYRRGHLARLVAELSKQSYQHFYEHQHQASQHQQAPLLAFIQQQNQLLKRYCLHAYPQASALHGQAWVDFLNTSAGQTVINDEVAQLLASTLYQSPGQLTTSSPQLAEQMYLAVQQWLQQAKFNGAL